MEYEKSIGISRELLFPILYILRQRNNIILSEER